MKINAIKRACRARGRCQIYDAPDGGQWIGDGRCFWPVSGLKITEDSVPDLFDLTPKQIDDMLIDQRDAPDWRFGAMMHGSEEALTVVGEVWWAEDVFIALRSGAGLLFIPKSALDPVKDDCVFYGRWERDDLLVAAYPGFFCKALIAPVDDRRAEKIMQAAQAIAMEPLAVMAGEEADDAADV
jgi:hypothetical protein